MGTKCEIRAALIVAAANFYNERDDDFTMSDIARHSGVSVGVAYQHFPSEQALIAEVIDIFFDRYSAVLQNCERSDWREREALRVRRGVDFAFGQELAPKLLDPAPRSALIHRKQCERRDACISDLAESIREGQRFAEISEDIDPDVAAAQIHGALGLMLYMALTAQEEPWPTIRENTTRIAKEMWQAMERLLELEPAAPSRGAGRVH